MTINSLEFMAFVAIVCLLYFIVPKKVKWLVLLLSSYTFYFINSGKLMIFMLLTTVSIYVSALYMGKIDDKAKLECKNLDREHKKAIRQKANKKKKLVIIIGLILNFGVLIFLKYGNFIIDNLNGLGKILSINSEIPFMNLLLPLGISYYTLQATSYIIDVYRGKYKPDKNFGRVALFVSFFPQIVEGPIGRYDRLANQLYEPHKFSYNNMKYGLQLILWGFFKKMVIADRAALYVDQVFGNYTEYSGIIIIGAIVLYTLQIYAEFSGCMDIVRGISQILGINLDKNFERPFFSKSVQEFWRRWNITLGTWLKDYVFYSVSFSKVSAKITNFSKKFLKGHIGKLVPAAFALFFVWFANGLWHGASWKYIMYGLYYYAIMMLGMLFEPLGKWIIQKLKINTEVFSYKLWQILRTTGFVFIGMLIFRSPDLHTLLEMLRSALSFQKIGMLFDGSIFSIGFQPSDCIILCIGVLIMLVVSIFQEKGYKIREEIAKQNLVFRWVLYYGIIFSIIIFGIYGEGYNISNFIYGQF